MFIEYDALLAKMGIGGSKGNIPKPSTFGKQQPESKPSPFGKKKTEHNLLAKELDKSIFKRENFMQGYRKTILSMYAGNNILMQKNGFDDAEIVELKSSHSKITKVQYCQIVSNIFRNKEIYTYFLSCLEADVKKVFEAMVWEGTLSEKDILEVTGVDVVSKTEKKGFQNQTYFETNFKKEFMVLAVETESHYNYKYGSYNKNFHLEIPIELSRVLREYYEKPLNYNFNPLKEIPKTEYISSNETEIFINLPNLISYNQQGNIKTSGSGKIMASTLGKIRKTLNVNEFYDTSTAKNLQQLKAYLLASLVVCEEKPKNDQPFLGILKSYVEKTYLKKYHSHTHLLTHLKGGHNLYQVYDVESEFLSVLKILPINEWISIQNFIDFTSLRGYNFTIARLEQICHYLTYETEEEYGKNKNQVTKINYKEFCNEPIIKGSLMLWACYGLLDVAYDTIDTTELGNTYFSNYDGIKAIKLTNLGAYLLGKTTEYEVPTVKQSYELIFSTDNLIILVEGETTLTDNLLANYADKVGANRYAVSNESFLKNVVSKKDLKVKIDVFKQVINQDLPANWITFFEILDKKIHPLTPINEVMVFKIPSDDPELIKLLIQNQAIKKLLIKAEDYQIIVLKKDYPALRTKLKTYGYLLS